MDSDQILHEYDFRELGRIAEKYKSILAGIRARHPDDLSDDDSEYIGWQMETLDTVIMMAKTAIEVLGPFWSEDEHVQYLELQQSLLDERRVTLETRRDDMREWMFGGHATAFFESSRFRDLDLDDPDVAEEWDQAERRAFEQWRDRAEA